MAVLTFREVAAAEQTSAVSLLVRTSTQKDTGAEGVGEEEEVVRVHPFQDNVMVCSSHHQLLVEVKAHRKALP